MAAVGDVLDNPVTGERFTVLAVPRGDHDWGRAEILYPPGAQGPPRHVHERTQERISVVEGILTVSLGGRRDRRQLREGETLELPPGIPHRFWNPGDAPVRLIGEARPGAQLGAALERLCQLAQQGKVTKRGAPKNPLEVALLFEQSEMYLTGIPLAIQRPLQRWLAGIARRRGYEGRSAGGERA
jgi:mannose-6-phosphate isomerase-like protein (cupin superfamily)